MQFLDGESRKNGSVFEFSVFLSSDASRSWAEVVHGRSCIPWRLWVDGWRRLRRFKSQASDFASKGSDVYWHHFISKHHKRHKISYIFDIFSVYVWNHAVTTSSPAHELSPTDFAFRFPERQEERRLQNSSIVGRPRDVGKIDENLRPPVWKEALGLDIAPYLRLLAKSCNDIVGSVCLERNSLSSSSNLVQFESIGCVAISAPRNKDVNSGLQYGCACQALGFQPFRSTVEEKWTR